MSEVEVYEEAHQFLGVIEAGKPFSLPEADFSELNDEGRIAIEPLFTLIRQNPKEATHILSEAGHRDVNLVQNAARAYDATDESYRAQLLRELADAFAAGHDLDIAYDTGSERIMKRNRDRLTPEATRVDRVRTYAARTTMYHLTHPPVSTTPPEASGNVA